MNKNKHKDKRDLRSNDMPSLFMDKPSYKGLSQLERKKSVR
jgi:hypothetical protein